MNRFLARTQPFSSKLDIRATHLPIRKPLNFDEKLRFVCLLIGDILALAAAWGIARFFNQFYSPIPQRLVWWVWFGLPSIFWILVIGFWGLVIGEPLRRARRFPPL